MLGKRLPDEPLMPAPSLQGTPSTLTFGVEERNMVSGVLTLAERSIHSVMTPRTEISWINLDDTPQDIQKQITSVPHSFFPVCRASVDDVVGIGRAKDMIADLLTHGNIRKANLREPIIVHDTISIIRLMDTLKRSRGQLVLVADEFGIIQGLVTPIDVFEAIAGEFPDEDETPDIVSDGIDQWRVDGAADLHHLEQVLDTEGLVDDDQDYTTLAGYLLERFGQLPVAGDQCEFVGAHGRFKFEVIQIEGRRIAQVRVKKIVEGLDSTLQ
jgi:CBS domain containing-hemolysin-like protein